jgi:signal transduction histidine kinase
MPDEVRDFLKQNRDALLARWEEKVRASLATVSSLTTEQLRDSLGLLLDEILESLEPGRGRLPDGESSPIARGHGAQRQVLNTAITDLVREYYLFLEGASELASEQGASLGHADLLEFTKALFSATADAVVEFARRQEEQQRQADFEYFAFVAHELRNPLSSTKLAWDVLVRKTEIDPRRVEVINRGLGRLTELIDDSITRARIQSGVGARREPVAVDALVSEAQEDSLIDAETKNVRVAADATGLVVPADHRLLRSALTNLLRNAIKFTREGGEVTIRGRLAEGRVLIEVEDECGGLPPDRAEWLFAAFEQAGRDRSGFGLGLAISKQAIEAHAGTLSVKDVPGKGCVFTVDLPAAEAKPGRDGAGGR